ncbi:MAG: GNAT family N-acetyltransferase [Clostridiales bacterium]|nr:GNAT family N-acetyltransferase [Clostridiales bacterium]
MENIIFRKATFDDLDNILEIGNLIAEFDVSETPVSFWDYETLEKCLSDETSGLILTAYNENELAGFVIVTYNLVFKKAIIEDMYVPAKFRNLGIAKRLYSMVINEAKENGIDTITIMTEFNNTSIINFFEKNGFDKFQNQVQLILNL